jgi:predicted carbohydrate-binding protein with CBM5 and CBM33 domain
MKSTIPAVFGLAGLVSTVAGHGFITSPKPRLAGTAMAAACGQQMFNNQAADNYGNIQGELQVSNGQSDFNAAECDVWLCKGFKFDDNKANVQTFTAGEKVPITIDIRAPHTGTANVSIVKTSSNSVIGSPLVSWDVYASNSATIPDDQKNFDITIPSDLGSECSIAGDCVIQWFWDARSIDQTYESCIDFTVGGSGSGSSAPVSSAKPATSSAAASTPAVTPTPTPSATPVNDVPSSVIPAATSAAASPVASSPATGGSSTLPETFTLETFITWLQEVSKSSSSKVRRTSRTHARAF